MLSIFFFILHLHTHTHTHTFSFHNISLHFLRLETLSCADDTFNRCDTTDSCTDIFVVFSRHLMLVNARNDGSVSTIEPQTADKYSHVVSDEMFSILKFGIN